jgi:hypothetical protein
MTFLIVIVAIIAFALFVLFDCDPTWGETHGPIPRY